MGGKTKEYLPWSTLRDPRAAKKKLLRIAQNELTPRQMQIVTECIFNGRKQSDVARELGMNRATVCRTLNRAMHRIKKYAQYMD